MLRASASVKPSRPHSSLPSPFSTSISPVPGEKPIPKTFWSAPDADSGAFRSKPLNAVLITATASKPPDGAMPTPPTTSTSSPPTSSPKNSGISSPSNPSLPARACASIPTTAANRCSKNTARPGVSWPAIVKPAAGKISQPSAGAGNCPPAAPSAPIADVEVAARVMWRWRPSPLCLEIEIPDFVTKPFPVVHLPLTWS